MESIIDALLNKNKITLESVKLAIGEFSDRKFGKEKTLHISIISSKTRSARNYRRW